VPASGPANTVILDATVVIHLARAGRLGLLGRVEGYEFVVTEQVVNEVTYPEQAAALRTALEAGHLRVESSTDTAELALYAELRARMGKGEAASLAMAACRGWMLASDDRGRAFRRLVRERLGLSNLEDTLAIVTLAEDRGVITPEEAEAMRRFIKG